MILGDFARGLARGFSAVDVNDERLWSGGGQAYHSSTGTYVTPTLAFQTSCFFHGVRLYAETLGGFSLKFYREEDDGNRDRVRGYWLRSVLDTKKGKANVWQSAQQWREVMVAHSIAWGCGLSEITTGTEGRPLDLVPLDPNTTTTEQLPDNRLRYQVQRADGRRETLSQDRVFRLQGFGVERFMGANLLSLCRETIGLWLAVEKYNGLYFAQGARPSLFLEHPGKPDESTMKRLKETVKSWQGVNQMHRVLIGEQGLKPHTVGWSAKDSLLPEQKEEIAIDMARWLNLPIHVMKVGQQPTFASIEQFARELIDYGMRTACTRVEGAVNIQLVQEEDIYCEHNLDALLRGNTLERYQAYVQARIAGWITKNEIRQTENRNRVDGGDSLDAPLTSNVSAGSPAQGGSTMPAQPPTGGTRKRPRRDEAAAVRQLRLMTQAAAERAVHRELAAVQREAGKLASKPAEWTTWLAEFYRDHAAYVAEGLQVAPLEARSYCEGHRAALAAEGLAASEGWQVGAVAELVRLKLGEQEEADAAA